MIFNDSPRWDAPLPDHHETDLLAVAGLAVVIGFGLLITAFLLGVLP